MATVLARSVLSWQERLSLIDAKPQVLYSAMSEAEVDAALSNVFERVCRAIDAQPDAKPRLENPLAKLTREQLAGMRPAVVRLIASYLVLLERLKAQQLRMAGSAIGEKLWRMPLGPKYDKLIDPEIADMRNVSNGRDGGADTCDISHVHVHKVAASRCSDFLEALHVDVSKDDGVAVSCHRRTKCLSDSTRSTRYNYNSSHQMFLTELCPLVGMRINRLEMAGNSHAWYRASCSLADLTGIGVGCNGSQKGNRCIDKPLDVRRIGEQKSRNIRECQECSERRKSIGIRCNRKGIGDRWNLATQRQKPCV